MFLVLKTIDGLTSNMCHCQIIVRCLLLVLLDNKVWGMKGRLKKQLKIKPTMSNKSVEILHSEI